jgi:hypothetical protein
MSQRWCKINALRKHLNFFSPFTIFYIILRKEFLMLKIKYSSFGFPVSDFACEDWIKDLCTKDFKKINYYIHVSTDNIIQSLRLAICEKRIDRHLLVVIFKEKTLRFDDDAMIIGGWPNGFCDIHSKIAKKIMTARIKQNT